MTEKRNWAGSAKFQSVWDAAFASAYANEMNFWLHHYAAMTGSPNIGFDRATELASSELCQTIADNAVKALMELGDES